MDRSACASTCATYWPPLPTHGKPAAGKGIQGSLLVTHRAGGEAQASHRAPARRFGRTPAPARRGQDSGVGASWYVLSATGKKIATRPRARRRLATGAVSKAACSSPPITATGSEDGRP